MSLLDWPLTEERKALASAVLSMTEGSQDELAASLDQAGIAWIGTDEAVGGSGGQDADLAVAVRVLAGQAREAAIAETGLVSAWALRQCGHSEANRHVAPVFDGGTEFTASNERGQWHITGSAHEVAGTVGAQAALVPVEAAGALHLALVPMDQASVEAGTNLAGESRADLHFSSVGAELMLALPAHLTLTDLRARLALARALQISGALLSVRELTVGYARTREQFGKPIAEQQVVAHMLASIAEQSLMAEAAVATAINEPTTWHCAIAKSVASRAARSASMTAHQVHGAMGMSQEYPLGGLTTHLWCWAEEGGRPEAWEAWIGSRFMAQDEPQLWKSIVNPTEGANQ